MNDLVFTYSVSLININVIDSIHYATYINSLYKENIDYTLSIHIKKEHYHIFLLKQPEELHNLLIAAGISFRTESDLLAFKLKFDILENNNDEV
jgi:hypothetical protein